MPAEPLDSPTPRLVAPLARQAAAKELVVAGPAIEMTPREGEDLGAPCRVLLPAKAGGPQRSQKAGRIAGPIVDADAVPGQQVG